MNDLQGSIPMIRQESSQQSLPILPLGTKADKTTLGYVGRTPGTAIRDSDAWYTPRRYIESARVVMGSIDLDPFSSAHANEQVQARYYFTPESSALTGPWLKARWKRHFPQGLNVWMNPPYSPPLIQHATERFLKAYSHGEVLQGIVLVNNSTETQWFRALREASSAVCFPTHRIAFTAPDGKAVGGNTRAQVFFYFGSRAQAEVFTTHFQQYGWTIHGEAGWIR